jgi:hypothetical protein
MQRLFEAVRDYLADLGVGGWLLILTGVVVVASWWRSSRVGADPPNSRATRPRRS